MKIRRFSSLVLIATLVLGTSCRKKSSSTTTTTTSSIKNAVAAVAVTTPTAHKTTSSAFLLHPKNIFNYLQNNNFFLFSKAYAGSSTTLQSYSDFQTTFAALLAKTTVADVFTGFSLNGVNASSVNCYGPSITTIANHPDGSGGTNLPSGDLGIWVSTETQSEACSAAKINSVIAQLQALILQASTLMAGVNVAATLSGASLPVAGDAAIDVTTSVAAGMTAFTVSSAKLEALTDVGGFHVYKTTIAGTDSSSRPISFVLKHSPTSTDNSTYTGIFYGYMPVTNNTDSFGFSLIYTKTASKLTFLLKSGETSRGSYDGSVLLNTDGTFNFSGFKNNAYRTLAEIDPTTNLGTIYLAWQAGSGDGNTRVFQATTTAGTSSTTGVAYFGFGPDITTTDGSMTKMICNWAGPGNNHTGITKVQAQTMQKNTTTGIFTVVTDYISYANTNSCNHTTGTYQMTQLPGGTAGTTLTTVPTISNALVTYGSVGTISTISVPTAPF